MERSQPLLPLRRFFFLFFLEKERDLPIGNSSKYTQKHKNIKQFAQIKHYQVNPENEKPLGPKRSILTGTPH